MVKPKLAAPVQGTSIVVCTISAYIFHKYYVFGYFDVGPDSIRYLTSLTLLLQLHLLVVGFTKWDNVNYLGKPDYK